MAVQTKQKSIWKIGIKQKLDIKDVETVVAEAQKNVGKDFDALIELGFRTNRQKMADMKNKILY
jgi:hypothetical protein